MSTLDEYLQQLERLPSRHAEHDDSYEQPEQERYELCQRILDTLSEQLLHPITTKSIVRRFRPQLVKLVAHRIQQAAATSKQDDSEATAVLDSNNHYRGLSPSEMAHIAFSVLLPMAPQIEM